MVKFFTVAPFVLVSIFVAFPVYAGTLSCSVTTAAACTGTVIYRMSGSSNAHAELSGESNVNYDNNVVCCTGVSGLGNSCTGTFATILKMSQTTNAHSQINSKTDYTNNACMSVSSGGTVSVGYVTSPITCTGAGYDTTLGTLYADTNSHVGDTSAYSTRICASATGSSGITATGTLTSSVFDTTANSASIGYNSIMWKGSAGTGKVRFQLAASASSTGPWNYYGGSTCGSLDWFDTTGPNVPAELKGTSCVSNWNNKRYFRYKVQVCSATDCVSQGTTSPIIDGIIVNWSS